MEIQQFKICVLGGSGFIGQEVCRLAVAMGHRVVSVSTRGRPDVDEPWVEGVEWIEADVLASNDWAEHLDGCEAVVHCVGTLIEDEDAGQTYEWINRDSTILAAIQAEAAGVPKFVYLSTGPMPAPIPDGYLESKRQAEKALHGRDIDVAILRPVLVYSPERVGTAAVGLMMSAASQLPGLEDWAGERRGLRLEKVAMATLRAALEPGVTGVLDVDDIDHLGDAMMIQ